MKSEYLRVVENRDLIKSTKNSAVLNTNTNALDKYRQERDKIRKQNMLSDRVDKIENDLSEIKDMLGLLLKRKE